MRYIRIGILIDGNGSGGVRTEYNDGSGLDAAFGNRGGNFGGDINHFIAAVCFDTEYFVNDLHVQSSGRLHLFDDFNAQQFT